MRLRLEVKILVTYSISAVALFCDCRFEMPFLSKGFFSNNGVGLVHGRFNLKSGGKNN
jgi:hypothetical protein